MIVPFITLSMIGVFLVVIGFCLGKIHEIRNEQEFIRRLEQRIKEIEAGLNQSNR